MDETSASAPQTESSSEEPLKLSGYLLVMSHAAGSKSESYVPHLVSEGQSVVRLHVRRDSPFGTSSLSPYHGRFVEITGHWGPRNRFVLVSSCSAKTPPFLR